MSQRARIVLIVDDSPEDRELYRRYLLHDRDYLYTILEASLGQQGLDLWEQFQPDLVLLDYRLPDLDGLAFLAQLSPSTPLPCLPVIVVTGQGNEAIAVQAIKAGAQDYLVKGQITPERLHLAVNGAIKTMQLRTQLQQQIGQEQLIRQISQQIHQSLNLEDILQTAVTEVRQFLQTDRVLVFQLDSEGNGTIVAESVAAGWRSVLSAQMFDPCFTAGYIDRYQQGRVMAKADIYDGSLKACHVEFLAQFQVRANLVVPILHENDLWGLLIAQHCKGSKDWNPLEIGLMQQLVIQLGIALQQANTYAQLAQSEARYRTIIEDQTELIIRHSPDSTIQFVNSAYCRYFGLQPEAIVGKSYQPIIFADDRDTVVRQINAISAINPTATIEYRVVIDDQIRWTQWIHRMVFNEQGQCTEFQAVGRDITPLKQAETQLLLTTQRLSLANTELAKAARLKDEFLATMSHELRTPLNPILGMSEILLEEIYGSISKKQRRLIQTIEQSGQHLLSLINDILDLSKIESGNLDLEWSVVSIYPLCESSLNFAKIQAHQKNIQLSFRMDETAAEIQADERRLRQVLVNLLTNAVKFTPNGGSVKLEVKQDLLQQAIEFRITDSGIGIASEHLTQIFQPFFQIDSALSRHYEGTGLGLSIVQHIVNLHGGSIQVESVVGQGSCFSVVLPCRALSAPTLSSIAGSISQQPVSQQPVSQQPVPQQPVSQLAIAAQPSGRAARILLAEDNETNIAVTLNYLEARGFEVMLARNGLEAVQMTKQQQPDLILMDIQMPQMNGLTAIRQIRADAETQSIPIIALTALAMSGDLDRCLAAGATDYLAKPFQLQRLLTSITQHLSVQ
jgi:PAS domain S-box-containing protein